MKRSTEVYFKTEHLRAEIGTSALRSGNIVMSSQILVAIIRTVSTIILARLLTPTDVGLCTVVMSVTSALLIFKDLGLCDAIIQWPSISHRQVSVLFWINLAVSAGTGLVVVLLAPAIAWFYGDHRLVGISMVWALVFVIGGSSAQHLALLKRGMFFSAVSILTVVATLLSGAIAIALALWGAKYWSLIWREVLTEGFLAVGAWFICFWRPGAPSRASGIRPMLAFGGHTIMSFMVRRWASNFDRALIGWRFGAQATGYYAKAFDFAALPATQISGSLRNVAVAALSKVRSEPEAFRQYYLKAVRTLAFIGFAVTAFLVLASEDLIALLLGPKWSETGRLLKILSLSTGAFLIYFTHVWIHFALGRADRLARWSVMSGLATVGVLLLGSVFGPAGIAWTYSISTYAFTIWGLWYAGEPIELRVSSMLQSVWRYFVASAGATLLGWFVITYMGFFAGHFSRICFFGVCVSLSYIVFLMILFGGPEPVREFSSMVRKSLPRKKAITVTRFAEETEPVAL
jgi:O-antigen/teichoic acid export membrane protein